VSLRDTESFEAVVPDGLSSGTDVDMLRLVVHVLSTAGEPAGCWFHHEKATPHQNHCLMLHYRCADYYMASLLMSHVFAVFGLMPR